ncbi:MAG TPA: c-type cytochrome [Gemmatimonadaceae bacterium]|nr:c-type cytochrome [Gemmatimonadaceae bacterium]
MPLHREVGRKARRLLTPTLPIIISVFAVAFVVFQEPADLPHWAFPGSPKDSAVVDSTRLHRVPNSDARFTLHQAFDRFAPPDWHPSGHPQIPDVVAHGRKPDLFACAYCHLPNGAGRPENAPLAGLPEAYIIAQLADFRSSARRNPLPGWIPGNGMHAVAMSATQAEIATAARYFSRLPSTRRVRVIEAARVPRMREAGFVYARIPAAGTESIGTRIIEGPPDLERHELRDDGMTYVAYVPPGSIKRGSSVATKGVNGLATACITCHGKKLNGIGLAPPLAGRYPTYLVRQLLAFKAGTRSTPASQPMQAVVARMSIEDMIAAAAYAASLSPARTR